MNYEVKKIQLSQFKTSVQSNYFEGWLITELEKAWKALEFYADTDNYRSKTSLHLNHRWVEGDQGKRAREALGLNRGDTYNDDRPR